MRKKTVFLAAIAVLLAAIAAVGTSLAYFTDQKTAQNTFTVGSVKIELTEPGWTDGAKLVPGVPAAGLAGTGQNGVDSVARQWSRGDPVQIGAEARA